MRRLSLACCSYTLTHGASEDRSPVCNILSVLKIVNTMVDSKIESQQAFLRLLIDYLRVTDVTLAQERKVTSTVANAEITTHDRQNTALHLLRVDDSRDSHSMY